MQARVRGSDLIKALNTISSAKSVINFTIDRGVMHLEVFEPIVITLPIPIVELSKQYEADSYYTVSVEMNSSYQLISEQAVVDLIISKDQLTMKAPGFNCKYKSVYEDRFIIPTEFQNQFVNLETGARLDNVVNISQFLSTYSKVIQTAEPAINIKDGYSYITASSVAVKSPLRFPDSVWIKNVLRAINATLSSQRVIEPTLKINNKSGVYGVINFGKDQAMAFNMKFSNNTQLDAIDTVIKSVKPAAKIKLSDMASSIKVIEKLYKRAEIKLIFGENSYYINMRVGTDNELTFGKIAYGEQSYIMDISMPMLSLLMNIFKSSNAVTISIKDRYVMFDDGLNKVLTTGLTQV